MFFKNNKKFCSQILDDGFYGGTVVPRRNFKVRDTVKGLFFVGILR